LHESVALKVTLAVHYPSRIRMEQYSRATSLEARRWGLNNLAAFHPGF